MDPFTMSLLASGASGLIKMLAGSDTGAIDPSTIPGLRMTDEDVQQQYGQTMQGIARPIQGQLTSSISNIRRSGAANRLPAGAVLAGIGGAQYRAGQAVGEAGERVMPQIKQQQRQSLMDYYNLANQYSMGQQQGKQNLISSFASNIGYPMQVAMLGQAGFFGEGGMGGASNGGGLEGFGGFDWGMQNNPNKRYPMAAVPFME